VVGVPGCVVTWLGAKDQMRACRLAFGWEVRGVGWQGRGRGLGTKHEPACSRLGGR